MGMNWDNEETLKEGENWILAVLEVNVLGHFCCLLNFNTLLHKWLKEDEEQKNQLALGRGDIFKNRDISVYIADSRNNKSKTAVEQNVLGLTSGFGY